MLPRRPFSPGICALSLVLLAACAAPERSSLLAAGAPAPIGPYSQAIRAGDTIYLAGQIGLDARTGELASGVEEQTRVALRNLEAVLAVAGLDLRHVVSTTVYLTDLNDFAALNAVYAQSFPELAPARATVGVAALPKGARVEISAIAVR
ncbi:MAG: Rid family detoxifying hydrolase [Planctomycetota bacterium]|nr:Rid family detoxifying hydrolase [Planctomycetota bacterium]